MAEDAQAALYNKYNMDSEYTLNSGTLMLPVAGPDGIAPRLIKTHSSIGIRKVRFDAHKSGSPPRIPKIGDDTDSGDVFLNGAVNFPLPIIADTQATYVYPAQGEYIYAQVGPRSNLVPIYEGSDQLRIDANNYGPRNGSSKFQTGQYPFNTPLIRFVAALQGNATIGQLASSVGNQIANAVLGNQVAAVPDKPNFQDPAWKWFETFWMGYLMSDELVE